MPGRNTQYATGTGLSRNSQSTVRICGLSLALTLIATWMTCTHVQAQAADPTLVWRTIETPHFRIHYHQPLALLARRTAAVAERAHTTLATVLGFEPTGRVELVLTDESDSANGSATALPYDTIRLYAEAPDDLSPLADYDDWITMLATHEHTHILHLDQATGIASVINAVLGKVYMPNHVSPRWFLEGLAVWAETQFTSGGRLRSTQWDMYLRMDALEDRFWSLDQVTNQADRWPHGNAQYLYGSFFVDFIAQRHGREALAEMVRDYGDSILPYGLNRIAQRATGFTIEELWDQFLTSRREAARATLLRIETEGRVEGTRLTHHGELARAPRFLHDGRLMYMRGDARSRSRIVTVNAEGNSEEEFARVNSGGEAAVSHDGNVVVYSRVEAHRDIYFYSDLFLRDLRSGGETRLTTGVRAREPDLAPDGETMAFTTSRAGTTHLFVANRHDVVGTMRELVLGPTFSQVYTPRFSPDGRTLACSRWMPGGFRDVVLVDVETGAIQELTHDRAIDSGPTWSADGRTVFFSSDRSGIANIYAYRLPTGRIEQITNVIHGAYQPAISSDGSRLVYVGYTSFGFDLFALDLTTVHPREAAAYIDMRPPSVRTDELFDAESTAYDPLATLYPRSYMLGLAQDSWGPQIGITFGGTDVLNYHTWQGRLGVGLARGTWQFDATYSYDQSPLGVSARIYRNELLANGLEVGGDARTWSQEVVGGSLALNYRFPRAFYSHSLNVSYSGAYTTATAPFARADELDPNTPPPVLPEMGFFSSLRMGWRYSDLERYTYDISPSNGRSISASASLADPLLGSQYRVVSLEWSVQQYVPLWEQHVLALRYAGGWSGGDLERRRVFGVGGYSVTNPFTNILSPIIVGGAALRGYPNAFRTGTQYHLAQAEYRAPIVRFNQGLSTLPVFINRLYALAFVDFGDAFSSDFDITTFRVGVGAELILDFTLFYFLAFSLRVGYARGLSEGGIDQVYGNLGVPF
jgi:Tol biopolymer transport system component